MARVVSLALFVLSWLLLFSYAASYSTECQVCTNVVDHINQQVQNNEARICPEKVEKVFDNTDVADSCSVKTYLIDELVNRVCYDLYGACTANTPSTEEGIPGQPVVKPSIDPETVNKESEQQTKVIIKTGSHISFDSSLVTTPSAEAISKGEKTSNDAERVKNLKEQNLGIYQTVMRLVEDGPYAPLKVLKYFNPKNWKTTKKDGKKVPNSKSPKSIKS